MHTTKTKHTPGPWEAQWSTRGGPINQEPETRGWHVFSRVKDMYGDEDVDTHGVIADIPAAAPELLEAVKTAAAYFAAMADFQDNTEVQKASYRKRLAQLDGLIAKAEGRAS
jgi:hypothetical protein